MLGTELLVLLGLSREARCAVREETPAEGLTVRPEPGVSTAGV